MRIRASELLLWGARFQLVDSAGWSSIYFSPRNWRKFRGQKRRSTPRRGVDEYTDTYDMCDAPAQTRVEIRHSFEVVSVRRWRARWTRAHAWHVRWWVAGATTARKTDTHATLDAAFAQFVHMLPLHEIPRTVT